MNGFRVVVVVGLLSLSVVAVAQDVAGASTSATTRAIAGEPVRSFRFGHLVAADAVNDRQLLVRVWPRRSWLLTVDADCDLTHAISQFAVTSELGTVRAGRDRVVFESSQTQGACRVRQIRPVDIENVASSGG